MKTFVLFSMVLAVACGGREEVAESPQGSEADWQGVDRVVYRFGDRAVPPPSHRSFTLTLSPGSLTEVADSYGDELGRREVVLDAAGYEALLVQLRGLSIRDTGESSREPVCTGGTSERLELHAGATERFRADRTHCASGPIGRLEGEVPRLVEILRGALNQPDCEQDSDCTPDDGCVPTTCVPGSQPSADEVCGESGPPIGDCVCQEGTCAEVPFDAPNGRNARRPN